jgi:hypothetical protein
MGLQENFLIAMKEDVIDVIKINLKELIYILVFAFMQKKVQF